VPPITLPSANSPQLVARLVEAVARGVRSSRGLSETLSLQAATVRSYVHAAQWLGFLEPDGEPMLTPLGLEYAYGGRQRGYVYARAVWANPVAADLLVASDGRLPDPDAVLAAVERAEAGLAGATLHRKASAVRALLAPAVGRPRPRARAQEERQLGLPLTHAPTSTPIPSLGPKAKGEYDPDTYRFVLACLLDFGELTLTHLRRLLDRADAEHLPIGGCVDMAMSRGDAVRVGERLVATADAVQRRDLVETTTSVMLSDPLYRAYLSDVVAAESDRSAGVRRDAQAARFRSWDRRLFGHAVRPDQVEADLEQVLMDRPLEAYPVASLTTPEPAPCSEGFLDCWEQRGLFLCLPPSLAQLQGGLPAVNRLLSKARQGSTGLPDLADRPSVYHGGLLHPGEPLPRSVPDARTLRLRLLMHAPYVALVAAVLWLHRLDPGVVEVREDKRGWRLRHRRRDLGELLAVLDEVALARGWLPCRRREGGVPPAVLVAVLEVMGIASTVGSRLVLAERLFQQLDHEPEELEVAERLRPLAEAVEAALETLEPL
jgi:hypothetical protein